jgi:HEAT repeat protein/tRNA A-37 threonylcarbamoyl transferase component Bud32
MSDVESSEVIGTTLAERYHILEQVGEGGMGVVYKARHAKLGSLFAVKILTKQQSSMDQARFLREAQLASSLKHPNIVFIADFGVLPDQRRYLAMEFLEGPSLKQTLRRGPLPPLRCCRIARQIAAGIHAAHEKGIVHRDLKPDNVILLEKQGVDWVKIIDFGIAKSMGPALAGGEGDKPDPLEMAGANVTRSGQLLGTPQYMSPEQIQTGKVDARADQYSLGCVLYHMLTGESPFRSDDFLEVLMNQMKSQAQPPRQKREGLQISDALEALVLRLLEKAPGQRFASMQEVEDALGREIEAMEIAAGLRPPVQKAGDQRWISQVPRRYLMAGGAGFLGLFTLLVIALLGRAKPDAEPSLTEQEALDLQQRALGVLAGQIKIRTLKESAIEALGRSRNSVVLPLLEEQLRGNDKESGLATVDALGRLGDRRSIFLLRQQETARATSAEQLVMALALTRLGDAEGEQRLRVLMAQQNDARQLPAALELCERGQAQAAELLSGMRDSGRIPAGLLLRVDGCLAGNGNEVAKARLRAQALGTGEGGTDRLLTCSRLAQTGDEQAREALRALANHPNPDRLLAARLLAGPSERGLAAFFRETLRAAMQGKAADPSSQEAAIQGLALSGAPHDARVLDGFLGETQQPIVRQVAASGVLRLLASDPRRLHEQSLRWAKDALADSDAGVRRAAADVLGDSAETGSVPLLARLLEDGDQSVRQRAVLAIKRRANLDGLPLLLIGVRDQSPDVRRESLRALLKWSQATAANRPTLLSVEGSLKYLANEGSVDEQILARGIMLRLGDRSQVPALQKLRAQDQPVLRQLLAETGSLEATDLVTMLNDADPEVRWSAARALADARDRRAIPVLRAELDNNRRHALVAFGLLTWMGESVPPPQDLAKLLSAPEVELRMGAVEAAPRLPVTLAVRLLRLAARDKEVIVRRLVCEVAEELPSLPEGHPGVEILRLLLDDSDPGVRARAGILLSRLERRADEKPSPREASTTPIAPNEATPDKATEGVPTRPVAPSHDKTGPEAGSDMAGPALGGHESGLPDGGPKKGLLGTGLLLVKGGKLSQFQVDKRGWQAAGGAPLQLIAGPHQLMTLAGIQTVNIEGNKTTTISIEESQPESLVRAGIEAFEAKDYKKAQRMLGKVKSICARSQGLASPCATLTAELSYYQAQMFEGQERWADAMNEYETLSKQSTALRSRVERQSVIQKAMGRLAPQLGQVVIQKKMGNRCQPVVVWMPPGTHVVNVDGKSESVKVRAREVAKVGACP